MLARRIAATWLILVGAAQVPAQETLRWSVTLDASLDQAWAAFTTEAGVRSWMAPVARVDFRIGGTIQTNYDPAAAIGDAGTIVHHILSYEPRRMLSTRFTAPEDAAVVKIAEGAWCVYTFEPLALDRTRVSLAMCGFGDGEEWDAAREFFRMGNPIAFEKLRRHFEQ